MRNALILLAALGFATPVFSGTTALYSRPWEDIRIEVADNGDLRVGDFDRNYLLRVSGTSYLVSKKAGWDVMQLADIMTAFDRLDALRSPVHPSAATRAEPIVEKQGQVETNGHRGAVYKVTGLGPDFQRQIELVISDDPALVPAGFALGQFMEMNLLWMRHHQDAATVHRQMEGLRRILALGTIISGGNYKLERIGTADIEPKTLALPAKPLTAEEIVQRLYNAQHEATLPTSDQ